MKHSYSLQSFSQVFKEIMELTEKENLDISKCSIDILDGVDGDLHVMCYDNVSQRAFGLGLRNDDILPFNWRKHDKYATINQN